VAEPARESNAVLSKGELGILGGTIRKIILRMSVSVDGFIEGPNGELDWHSGGES
jgi:hypothetical protein